MNMGQMMLTLGAMVLLGLVILRVNNGFLSTGVVLDQSKYEVLAVSLATSMIEEASGKAFDQNTDTSTVASVASLSNIGKESGEVYPHFNDFDDYNGLVKVDNTMPSASFTILCSVCYVNPANPDQTSGTKTWHKKMTVAVSSPLMADTVRMSSIYSYFYFR